MQGGNERGRHGKIVAILSGYQQFQTILACQIRESPHGWLAVKDLVGWGTLPRSRKCASDIARDIIRDAVAGVGLRWSGR